MNVVKKAVYTTASSSGYSMLENTFRAEVDEIMCLKAVQKVAALQACNLTATKTPRETMPELKISAAALRQHNSISPGATRKAKTAWYVT